MNRFFRAAAALLIFLATGPVRAQSVDAPLIDAVQLISDGKNAQAEKLLVLLSEKAPDNDAVWYYLALARAGRQDWTAATDALQKAVQADSANYWYRYRLARLYLAEDRTDDAARQYEDLVRDFPDQGETVYELLDLYLKTQQYEKALDALDAIETERGPSEEVVRTRYDVLTAMGRQDEGAEGLERFSQQYALPSVLSILGDYYLADYADSLARARYEEALEIDSGYIPALLGVSEVHRHQRRYDDYFRTLEPFFSSPDIPTATKSMYIINMTRSLDPKILQLHRDGFDKMVLEAAEVHPKDSTLLNTVASYFYATGRTREAGPWFRKAAELYPESLFLQATYVQYLSSQEDWEGVRERSTEAFRRFRELAFLDYANMANYQLQDYEAIVENCRYLLDNYPSDKALALGAYSMMGDAWHEMGREKEAFKAYDKALRIDPSYVPVLNNYAYYLSLQGKKLKKAYNMSKKTVEAEPDNATYLDTFAWILHLMGKDLEAKPFFKHAMLYGGKESAVILLHYATVLEALGEPETAQVYRNQAARLDAQK